MARSPAARASTARSRARRAVSSSPPARSRASRLVSRSLAESSPGSALAAGLGDRHVALVIALGLLLGALGRREQGLGLVHGELERRQRLAGHDQGRARVLAGDLERALVDARQDLALLDALALLGGELGHDPGGPREDLDLVHGLDARRGLQAPHDLALHHGCDDHLGGLAAPGAREARLGRFPSPPQLAERRQGQAGAEAQAEAERGQSRRMGSRKIAAERGGGGLDRSFGSGWVGSCELHSRVVLAPREALSRILERLVPVQGTERVAIGAAVGRVLAAEIRSDVDLPPFEKSAMDGFAVRRGRLRGGRGAGPCPSWANHARESPFAARCRAAPASRSTPAPSSPPTATRS